MKFSPHVRYAVRVLFEIEKEGNSVSLSILSERTGIAFRAVEYVHSVLKVHGVTDSVIGQKGGIVIKKPLSLVTVGELVMMFDGGIEFFVCNGKSGYTCSRKDKCRTNELCREVTTRMMRVLNETSLASILKQASGVSD